MNSRNLRDDAASIFEAALERVDPEKMIRKCCTIDNNLLQIKTEYDDVSYNMASFEHVYVIGTGKAGAKMALGIESVLGDKIEEAVVAVKYGHIETLKCVRLLEAGHPVPDENSIIAANAIIDICRKAGDKDLVINLISGGGSAILAAPYNDSKHRIGLEDLQKVTDLLLACGAEINEINCVRKHMSAVKGGRLAELIYPAQSCSLILSDVIGDKLEVIASGLTVADKTSFSDAVNIFSRYGISESVPLSVMNLFLDGINGRVEDTPKPGNRVFATAKPLLLGTNAAAVNAASEKARDLGYSVMTLGSHITGEAREVAKVYAGIAKDAAAGNLCEKLPLCIIAGGETTVTLQGPGLGGRNQEMAVAFLAEYMNDEEMLANVCFLSAGTDGNDGPTDAAGGFADFKALKAAVSKGCIPDNYIKQSDSNRFLKETKALLITGPTNTNVCDLQIIIVRK